jgi:Holliday junction resolvase RusA-like endonuclease
MKIFNLPLPPSTNNLFFNVGNRRAPSNAYVAWTKHAGHELMSQRNSSNNIVGAYELLISVSKKCRGDIDNRIKAISDLLVKHGLVQDDSLADSVKIYRCALVADKRCHVSIWPSVNSNTVVRPRLETV